MTAMQYSLRKGVVALAAAVISVAGAAQAEDHSVLIMDGGFFPAVIYAHPGDSITFTNSSEISQILQGPQQVWMSHSVPVDGSYTLDLDANTPMVFYSQASDGFTIEGTLSYEPAPLEENG
jgi:plastocyanin